MGDFDDRVRSRKGQSVLEYVLIIAFVIVVVIVALMALQGT
jgi:hypothetical protein